ncbi:MAG TPA: serpin family protein [Aggregatilineales bacterium]|nr:serpin family protein [Aggregatilineales bacterium]
MASRYLSSRLMLLTITLALGLFSANLHVQAQSANPQIPNLVDGNTQFALKLYQVMRGNTQGNLLYSPYSISQALAMTYAGARGNTERQMRDALVFALPQTDLHPTNLALQSDLVARGNFGNPSPIATASPEATAIDINEPPVRMLRLANSLWGERTLAFDSGYLDLLKANYGAGLQPTDFMTAPEKARLAINAWVAKETLDRIQDIVPSGAIDTSTRLVLANAIYFKNAWQYPFDPTATANKPFTLRDGQPVDVPMMSQSDAESFGYLRGDGYQVIELPYAGQFGTMLIVLPDSGQFEIIEKRLDAKFWATITTGLKPEQIKISMPRFKFDFASELSKALQTLGMADAFNDHADFSGMGPKRLYISAILHKAFIAVDENGTEAAAATAVIVAAMAIMQPPTEITIDRPFIFAIRDSQTGSILFLGRVLDPSR